VSFWSRFFGSRRTDDLNDEIDSHLRMAARDKIERGESAAEADLSARRDFGNVGLVREATRAVWVRPSLDRLKQDIRYSSRAIRHTPGFAAITIITMALGIGATTAVFSLVNTIMIRGAPYPNASRLVVLHQNEPGLGEELLGASTTEYLDYKNRNRTCRYVAGYEEGDYDLTGGHQPERITAIRATADLFPTLGVWPVLGRAFSNADDVYGARRVAVLSYAFWKTRFGGVPDALGRAIRLDEREYTIVGVMPRGFDFPAERTSLESPPALWVPMQFSPDELKNRADSYDVSMIALLRRGVSVEKARQDMSRIVREFESEHPDVYNGNLRNRVLVDKLSAQEIARRKPALLMLAAAVGLVLLIACANVANLLLARAGARQPEIAMRSALGASKSRLTQQLLTESLMLSLCGALLGCGLAQGAVWLAVKFGPPQVIELQRLQVDWRVLTFAFLLSLGTGILCALVPAAEWPSADVNEALKRTGRSMSDSRAGKSIKHLLVMAEAALAMMLLIGAGLLIRSFRSILEVPPGFDPQGVVIVRTSFNRQRYSTPERRRNAERTIMERLRAHGAIQSAALTTHVPLADSRGIGFVVEGGPANEFHWADNALVDSAYFRTMRIPLLQGRTFGQQDTPQAPLAAVINQTMARRFWPSGSPLGKVIFWGGRRLTIVGVVGNVQIEALDVSPRPMIYNSVYQIESGASTSAVFVLRTNEDLRRTAGTVRRIIWSVDSALPVFAGTDMESIVLRSVAERAFTMSVLATFAALALTLAAVGLYGVLAYAVAQRTRELGLRMALGAAPKLLIRSVIADGLKLTFIGVAMGVIGGVALAGAMSRLLFGIRSLDPISFATATAALLIASLLASFLPALRAARVDPMTALRCE
jgi:putative ABC transport system permease protein